MHSECQIPIIIYNIGCSGRAVSSGTTMFAMRIFPMMAAACWALLIVSTPPPAGAGWLSDSLDAAKEAAASATDAVAAAGEQAAASVGDLDSAAALARARSGLEAAGQTAMAAAAKGPVLHAQAEEVAAKLSEFVQAAADGPGDELAAMLTEGGFDRLGADSACASSGTAIRCMVWNTIVAIDVGNHSATEAVGIQVSIAAPGVPPLSYTVKSAEATIPFPGLGAEVPELGQLGMFLRVRVANGTDGGWDINIGVTACAHIQLLAGLVEAEPCLPTEPVVTITNGQIVVAAKVAALATAAAAYGANPTGQAVLASQIFNAVYTQFDAQLRGEGDAAAPPVEGEGEGGKSRKTDEL